MGCLLRFVDFFWRRDKRCLVDCFFDVTEFFQLDVSFVFADLQAVIDALLYKWINVFEQDHLIFLALLDVARNFIV